MSVICSDRCSFFLSIFYPWLVEALAAEPRDMEGQLYWFKADSHFDAKTDFSLHRTYSYVSLIPNIEVPFIYYFSIIGIKMRENSLDPESLPQNPKDAM